MATVDLTLETFETTIKEPGITIIDFWAEWCGPCKMFGPIFEKVSETHPEIRFTKVDTEANQELSGMAGISSIPTLMIFRDGILLFNQAGALPEPALNQIIGKVQSLNMDEVRAELENTLEKSEEKGLEG